MLGIIPAETNYSRVPRPSHCQRWPASPYVPIILSYKSSKIALEYDLTLPSINASPPATTKIYVGLRGWGRQPTINPSTVGSVTIVVPGVEGVVVVFPATLDSAVVTIGGMLVAVYRTAQERFGGHHSEYGESRRWGQADLLANTQNPIAIEEFLGKILVGWHLIGSVNE